MFRRLLPLLLSLPLLAACLSGGPPPPPAEGGIGGSFSGERALGTLRRLWSPCPPVPETACWRTLQDRLEEELTAAGWTVRRQEGTFRGRKVVNLEARRGEGPLYLIGAHYDARRFATRDPEDPRAPVPGANDGGSGSAVLLELARVLDPLPGEVRLVFFDAEDQGEIDGWPWSVGAELYAAALEAEGRVPRAVIVVDMVGDADPRFLLEGNSDPVLQGRLWALASTLGYGAFFRAEPGPTVLDDHVPFRRRGWPAVDVIDLDYPPWHTTRDTVDQVRPHGLEAVGRTLETFLEAGEP